MLTFKFLWMTRKKIIKKYLSQFCHESNSTLLIDFCWNPAQFLRQIFLGRIFMAFIFWLILNHRVAVASCSIFPLFYNSWHEKPWLYNGPQGDIQMLTISSWTATKASFVHSFPSINLCRSRLAKNFSKMYVIRTHSYIQENIGTGVVLKGLRLSNSISLKILCFQTNLDFHTKRKVFS